MKKMIAVLLLLGLLAGICSPAAAEEDQNILDFPESGFTFTMPDYVVNMTGTIYSVSDLGETGYGSGIIFAYALYLPRSDEEGDAMNAMLNSIPNPNEPSEEVKQAYAEFMAPRTELFIIVGLAEGKNWEKDVLSMDGGEMLKAPVKIGDCGGFTYYLTTLTAEAIRARMAELNAARAEKQPLDVPSAGSTFKRPEGYYASALIDQCGLKGYSVGGAQVSQKHAGFLVNTGSSSQDYLDLVRTVQRIVGERAGVQLEPEIRIIGEEAPA